ncbi:hypothetical protein AeMF1_000695 [Aphanomyces euteiches]|nr:hypothetical protein AeMF1_000695 [Aphanomyces euteiches]KAH9195547.1 hypothetical protein AeNC1_002464 [Aphanomyces euteiches]
MRWLITLVLFVGTVLAQTTTAPPTTVPPPTTTAPAASLQTAYVRLTWANVNLTTIETNENTIRVSVVRYLTPLIAANITANTTANVTLLEIRAPNAAITVAQNFTIEFAVQAMSLSSTILTTALAANTTALTAAIAVNLTSLTSAAVLTVTSASTPSFSRLQIAPTPATLDVFAANASYVISNLRFYSPIVNATGFTGNFFALATLTRMRYAFYSLLGFKNDGFEDAYVMQVTNITTPRVETDVLVFVRINSTARTTNSTITAIASGVSNSTIFLADYMNTFGFNARNFSMAIDVPWTPPSNNWWITPTVTTTTTTNTTNTTNTTTWANTTVANATIATNATNPTISINATNTTKTNSTNTTTLGPSIVFPNGTWPPTPQPSIVVPMLDGGLINYPYVYTFRVVNASLAPVYLQPGFCSPQNQFCLHLKWLVDNSTTAFLLARIKAQQFINTTVLANATGPAINSSIPSIWTLYDIPRSNIVLDFIRPSDQALLTVTIAAHFLTQSSATSTVTSTTNSNLYINYHATPLNAKELVLEIRVSTMMPPPVATKTLQEEGCAYCSKLATQCATDFNCSSLKACVDNATSVWDQNNLIANGDYGDSLNTTVATANCFRRLPPSPGRTLYDSYMSCMINRACPFVTQNPSKLIWQAPTPGWIQIQTLPWNMQPSVVLAFNLSYANNSACPIYISQNSSVADVTSQVNACVFGDCEVVVLFNSTNVTTIDIVFNNHIGPMPSLLSISNVSSVPIVGFLGNFLPNVTITTKLMSSSALALFPIYDPVTNPEVPQGACWSCWLDFLQNCLLDKLCNSYINCIMKKSYQSIAQLIQYAADGATFDLSPAIQSCSDPSVPMYASWRALQNASQCYALRQCPVATQGQRSVIWRVPFRTQTITYTSSSLSNMSPSFYFNIQRDNASFWQYGGPNDFDKILSSLVGFPFVSVNSLSNTTNTIGATTLTWTVLYPSYAGYLPNYWITDQFGVPLSIVNDNIPSALLVVRNQTWNATAWNKRLL